MDNWNIGVIKELEQELEYTSLLRIHDYGHFITFFANQTGASSFIAPVWVCLYIYNSDFLSLNSTLG